MVNFLQLPLDLIIRIANLIDHDDIIALFNSWGQFKKIAAKPQFWQTLIQYKTIISPRKLANYCLPHLINLHRRINNGGHLYVFGSNSHNQLGLDDIYEVCKPTPIPDFTPLVIQVACGSHHTVCLTASGHIYSFGENYQGELGLGHRHQVKRPSMIRNIQGIPIDNVIEIACGDHHTLFLTEEKLVFAFGQNNYGQLGLAGRNIVCTPTKLSYIDKVKQIACNGCHSAILTDEGKVYTFGENIFWQLGPRSIFYNIFHNLLSSPNAEILLTIWGKRIHEVVGISNVNKVFCLPSHTIFSLNEETTIIVGAERSPIDFSFPQTPNLIKLPIIFTEVGSSNSFLTKSGELFQIQSQYQKTRTNQLNENGILALRSIMRETKFIHIADNLNHGAYIDNLNQLWTHGYNTYGQLGIGDQNAGFLPNLQLVKLSGQVKRTACGYFHTVIVVKN